MECDDQALNGDQTPEDSRDNKLSVSILEQVSQQVLEIQALYDQCSQKSPEVQQLTAEQIDRLWKELPSVLIASDFVFEQLQRLLPFYFQSALDGSPSDTVINSQVIYHFERFWQCYQPGEHKLRLQSLQSIPSENDLLTVIRRYRNAEMIRIIWRDVLGFSDLWETTTNLSEMADAVLQLAHDYYQATLQPSMGAPLGGQGDPIALGILGLGKLGAFELNLSSDIDLIFVYQAQGQTQGGARTVEHQHYFTTLGQKIINALSKVTADGFVFRVDMRLRPYGQSGALVQSFAVMENYYQSQGRDWERYALIKARPVAGDLLGAQQLLQTLRPFVYRRYIDYSVFESLREMKTLIRREVSRAGKADNIKIGSGGIREIEFVAQAFQLIRGGQDARLREPQLRRVYSVLQEDGLLPEDVVAELMAAYLFLRTLEHRLQAFADRQTHQLPENEVHQYRVARSLGYIGWEQLYEDLEQYRASVRQHFNRVVEPAEKTHDHPSTIGDGSKCGEHESSRDSGGGGSRDGRDSGEIEKRQADKADGGRHCDRSLFHLWWAQKLSETELTERLAPHAEDAKRIIDLLNRFTTGRPVRQMQAIGRQRLDKLMPELLREVCILGNIEQVLPRVLDVISAIVRRSAYISLLNENRLALLHLIKLCRASPWIAEQLALQPILLDELLDAANLLLPPPQEELEVELSQQIDRARSAVLDRVGVVGSIDLIDMESLMELLRHFKRAHALRVATAETSGSLPIMKASDYLTYLAEVILSCVQKKLWSELEQQYGLPKGFDLEQFGRPGFVIVGYGKLGGIELSYGSDLDLVFLHPTLPQGETSGPKVIDNSLFFTKMAQKITHALTARTVSGVLYEVDLRLRPSGGAGLLVSSLEAFQKYQDEKAWTWEHQALVRARAIAGSPKGIEAFCAIRHNALIKSRDVGQLKQDVQDMRTKMQGHLAVGLNKQGLFDLKQSEGGIVDIEFMVQYAVLRWACQFPELTEYTDNIRLLGQLSQLGLLTTDDSENLVATYLFYRSEIHRLALQKCEYTVPLALVGEYPQQVKRVWAQLFGA